MHSHAPRAARDDAGKEITFFSDLGGDTAKDKLIAHIHQDLAVDMTEREGLYPLGDEYENFKNDDAHRITEVIDRYLFSSYATEPGHWLLGEGGAYGIVAEDTYQALTGEHGTDLFDVDREGMTPRESNINMFFSDLSDFTAIKASDPTLASDTLHVGREDTTNPGSGSLDEPSVVNIQFAVGDSGTVLPRNVYYSLGDNLDGTAVIQITGMKPSTHVEDRPNPTGTGHHTEEDEIYPQ